MHISVCGIHFLTSSARIFPLWYEAINKPIVPIIFMPICSATNLPFVSSISKRSAFGQNSVAYLNQLDLIDDPAVFYNFHYYEPQVFTHQKAHFSEEMKDYDQTVTYPGDISGFRTYLKSHPEYLMKYQLTAEESTHDRKLMEKLLKNAVDFVRYSGCSLYCGEYGVIDSAPPAEAVKWIRDLLSILDANQIGHALWNYKALDFGLLDLNGDIVSEELLHFMIENNH